MEKAIFEPWGGLKLACKWAEQDQCSENPTRPWPRRAGRGS
ncbi:hypothetical protein SFOMI_5304 [Sphingobium fuliginis]|uniref:Uncharacterized protein n=1 Tax=Sphingobium fuliginis (strain ATCC 27551) TaxID=336203 RepID=A0A292ZP83_SPHSA|nr:hypothetical protein SFOMI_5304 [Sphingobium fuliginis]